MLSPQAQDHPMTQIIRFPRGKRQSKATAVKPAQSAEVIAFPIPRPRPSLAVQHTEMADTRTLAVLAHRAAELIEARCHGGGLRLVLNAIHDTDPEWLDDRISDRFDAIVGSRSTAASARAAAWQDAGCWLRGVEPPAPFRFSWRR
jgi:hypothetical protein